MSDATSTTATTAAAPAAAPAAAVAPAAPDAARRFRLLPDAEPAPSTATDPKAQPAAAVAEDPIERKHASLQRIHGELERTSRKQAKQLREQSDRIRDMEAKLADPYALITPDKLAERVIKGAPQKKPEEIAAEKADSASAEVEKLRAEIAKRDADAQRSGEVQALQRTVDGREDLAFVGWLGHTEKLYDAMREFAASHEDANVDDNERVALDMEAKLRAGVIQQIREGAKRVPAIRDLIAELAREQGLTPAATSDEMPDQRVSDGRRGGSMGLRAKTLTTSQATAVVERSESAGPRTHEQKVEAIMAKLAARRKSA